MGLTLDRNNNLTFDCHICHIFGSFSLCKHQEILYHNLHISIQEYHHFHPHVDLLQGISYQCVTSNSARLRSFFFVDILGPDELKVS